MKEKDIREKGIKLYDAHPQGELAVLKKLELPKKIKGKVVLDAGCGAGMQFFYYLFYGANVTGIDQSEKSISFIKEQCEKLGYNPNLIVGNVEKTNLPDESFDYIFSIGVLHHTPNIRDALKEFNRLIKPNGEITLLLYHKYSLEAVIRRIICIFIVPLLKKLIPYKIKHSVNWWDAYENPLWKTYSKKEIEKLCEEACLNLKCICYCQGTVLGRLIDLIIPPIIKRIIDSLFSKRFGWFLIVEASAKIK